MANFLCRTKGNSDPSGKPRVYFTCHPGDFDKHFDKLCKDIFKTHDCAIYYKEDMGATIPEQDQQTDLHSSNLIVVPVTFRLLTEANPAMDIEIPYAIEKHIPILPFLMEDGIDSLYSRKDKFGELQYLNPFSHDLTAISYEEKLKKHLEATLISDETAKQIRAAFDAYIFLSYRKKDRRYANELMRLIHANPECRDIAIWYDEFLTPGESFRQNIEKILQDSRLFALLVTPNLLEEPDGNPNFVMGKEYPAAHTAGVPILPAEMEKTDRASLCKKYADLPACVDPHDEIFKKQLLETVYSVATKANDDDPAHTFLIGLAYLDGIDVEVDRQRGLDLITAAGEMGLPEAMKKLQEMYCAGVGVTLDYQEAAKWAQRLAEHYLNTLGQNHPTTLTAQNNLAAAYNDAGQYQAALQLLEAVYAARVDVLGETDPDTLSTLSNLSHCYRMTGSLEKALQLQEKAYTAHCAVLGEKDPNTIKLLNNLAQSYMAAGQYPKALALQQIVCAQMQEILGAEHAATLTALSNLALLYNKTGESAKALSLDSDVYAKRCSLLGDTHPDTLLSLNNLALDYSYLQIFATAKELNRQAYELCCSVLGEEHPTTLNTLNNYAYSHTDMGEYDTALGLLEKAYKSYCNVFGQESYGAMLTVNNMASTAYRQGELAKAAYLYEVAYSLCLKLQGDVHPETQTVLDNLLEVLAKTKNAPKLALLQEHKYIYLCKTIGQAHPNALQYLGELVISYSRIGNWQKCAQLAELLYSLRRKLLGEKHPHTLVALANLAFACRQLGQVEKAEQLQALYEKLKAQE